MPFPIDPLQPRGRPRARHVHGFTLIELTVVVAILCVSVALFAQTMLASAHMDPVSEETCIAAEAARIELEEMRALPFSEILASYDESPANDPGGAGTAPGAWFAVPGLAPPPGVTAVGHVIFPVVGGALSENLVDDDLGFPRDLNGDGLVDALDHSQDAIVLPVRVVLEWSSKSGRQGKRRLLFYDMFARL